MSRQDDEPMVIVTMRCSDNEPTPGWLGGSVKARCDDCDEEVWISNTTLPHMQENQNHRVVCNRCIGKYVVKEDPKDIRMVSADKRLQAIANKYQNDILKRMIKGGGDWSES